VRAKLAPSLAMLRSPMPSFFRVPALVLVLILVLWALRRVAQVVWALRVFLRVVQVAWALWVFLRMVQVVWGFLRMVPVVLVLWTLKVLVVQAVWTMWALRRMVQVVLGSESLGGTNYHIQNSLHILVSLGSVFLAKT